MYRSLRRATFKTSAWFVMKQANAGANAVKAVSLSASTAIHTDMLPVASAISNVAATAMVAASASARPVSASESAPIVTEKVDNDLNTSKAAGKSAAFSDANWNSSERMVSRHSERRRSAWAALHMRGACSPQPLHEPKSPDHTERENEKRSAGKERRHCTGVHDILQEIEHLQFLFATGAFSLRLNRNGAPDFFDAFS